MFKVNKKEMFLASCYIVFTGDFEQVIAGI